MLYKTKVAMVTGEFLPHIGGVEIHIAEVCSILKDTVDLTVVCAAQGDVDLPYKVIRDYNTDLNQFDIVHFHDFSHYRDVKVPSYITFHGYEGHVPPAHDAGIMRREICKRVSGTIHIGNYLRKWYGTGHHNDITILGGCDLRIDPEPRTRTWKIGYIGRISEDKRTDLYEKAMPIIQNTFTKEAVLEIASSLPHDKVKDFWADKDIAFCNGQLSMLEAMSSGVPVIALASNAMVADMLKDMNCPIADNEHSIASIFTSMRDPELYERTRQKQYQFSQQHSWQNAANKYLELWRLR